MKPLLLVLLIVSLGTVGCDPTGLDEPEPKSTPLPVFTPGLPLPSSHEEGEPHGLGVTNRMVVDALVPLGFDFVEDFSESMQRPLVRGYASLGPYIVVWAAGSPPGVIEFSMQTHWSREDQSPIPTILSTVDLVTPHWAEAREWVREQIVELSGQDDVTREIEYGNYAVRVYAFTVDDNLGIQVSISPRFASCADALAAQDWTMKGSVGNERGYAQWRVPSALDPDEDRTVCEAILQ